jgi:hypothetical protein
MLYGASIWSYGNKELDNRVLKLQKRAARIILGAERTRIRSITMFNSLDWLPFSVDSYINRCGLIFKRVNGQTSSYLKETLKLNSDIHTRNTGFCNLNFICPKFKKATEGGLSFSVRSIKDWNSLDKSLKESPYYKVFKKKLFN